MVLIKGFEVKIYFAIRSSKMTNVFNDIFISDVTRNLLNS